MNLHILTACTRPGNLRAVAESIADALLATDQVEVDWHIRFDLDQQHVGGQHLKNEMLNDIVSGWVWILDDDTRVHPDLFRQLGEVCKPGVSAVVFSQQCSRHETRHTNRGTLMVGGIDAGQAVMRRDLIGGYRIPLSYDGDGHFLVKVLDDERVLFLDEVLCYHNRLRWQ